jgi:type IV pilus assembly protein PilO
MNLKAEWQQLRELDWRHLDLQDAGSWPLSLKLLCQLLVMAVLFWLIATFLATPRAEALDQARGRESELLRQYERKAYQAANLPVMRQQMEQLKARMDVLLEMLPTGVEVPALIDSISETAFEHRLTIDFIRLRPPTPRKFYAEQPFDIQVQGGYHQIAAFVSGIAGLSRIVTLHDFELVPMESGQLRLSMLAKTYSHRPGGRS